MRRAPAVIRELEVDPVFRSVLVSQLINKLLWKGKKEKARRIVYGALEIVERRAGQDPIQIPYDCLNMSAVSHLTSNPNSFL